MFTTIHRRVSRSAELIRADYEVARERTREACWLLGLDPPDTPPAPQWPQALVVVSLTVDDLVAATRCRQERRAEATWLLRDSMRRCLIDDRAELDMPSVLTDHPGALRAQRP